MKCGAEAQQARAKLVGYFRSDKARIEYGKFICRVRLKRSGGWWKVDNANNVLKLRCAKYNSKFDDVFEQHEAVNRKQPQHCAVTLKRVK
ncbi:MAG: hypothetical protein FWF31_10970 [Desulfobulbus sp.]|nr:hypothetical protein [Desulfobulbus sp.]